jgi:hypothetical protein
MKMLVRAILLLAVAGCVHAADPPPVLLIVHGDIGVKTTNGGSGGLLTLGIGAWANHSVNKQSAIKVARFKKALGDVDFQAEASRAFGCVGATGPCADRVALTDIAQFELALTTRPGRDGLVIEVTPELIAEQMLIRAITHHVVLSDNKPSDEKKPRVEQGAGYIAVATTRAPKELVAQKKSNPTALEQYWSGGEPSRIVGDARRGLAELTALFTLLAKDGQVDGKLPEAWKQLPKVKELKSTGRIACSGPAWCASTYVLKDNGDSFTLVSSGSTAGWLDANAAANESNLPAYAMLGLPWK